MRAIVMAAVFFAAVGGASAQLPAQKGVAGKGKRPTSPPAGKVEAAEPGKTPETKLKRVQESGDQPKTKECAAIADINYMVGVRGYARADGFVVLSTARLRDLNQRSKVRCAAEEIEVDFQGNGRTVKLKLEGGDKITAIDGYEVKTPEELSVALNTASDPHAVDITFIDWRSGNEYTGRLNAMKVK